MSPSSVQAIFSLAFLATSALAAPHVPRDASHWRNGQPKAIYFMTNEAENSIVALPVAQDGTLSKGTMTNTGGKGSVAALHSQSSVVVEGNHLFVVNAGSNTLSMFAIDSNAPTSLRLVGQPVAVPGDYPNTVAASLKNKLVCVGTTGSRAGISCASFSESRGVGEMDALREFALGQANPPVNPNTVSQTFFSWDHSKLFTTVKGDAAKNNTGFLSAFDVDCNERGNERVDRRDIRSSPKGTTTLFGSAAIPHSDSIIATDPTFGAAILSVDRAGIASTAHLDKIPGQKAACWATISHKTRSAFVTDGAVNRLVELSVEDGSVISNIDLANGDLGMTDLESGGNYIYALAPNNASTVPAINVVDISGGQRSGKMVQHFTLGGIAKSTVQGMALFL